MSTPESYASFSTNSSHSRRRRRSTDGPEDDRHEDHFSNPSQRGASEDSLQPRFLKPTYEAWDFDVGALLEAKTHMPNTLPSQQSGNNFTKYNERKSIFVLAILGDICSHVHFLW
jgi:hypothetical protein